MYGSCSTKAANTEFSRILALVVGRGKLARAHNVPYTAISPGAIIL